MKLFRKIWAFLHKLIEFKELGEKEAENYEDCNRDDRDCECGFWKRKD